MSYPPYFPDPGTLDDGDQHHSPQQDPYHSYSLRPLRPHSQATLGNLLLNSTTTWSPPAAQSELTFLQNNSNNQQYFALSSALNNNLPESSQQHPYIPTPKLENSALYQQPPTNFSRYPLPPGYLQFPSPYISSLSYTPAEPFQPPNDLILLEPDDTSQTDVKEEPRTPTSPQFIFEFPGGEPEDEPQPFELVTPDPLIDDLPTGRPASPATEEMRSMMTVFRVDPFASYDADSGTARRRRRKRASTYARLADPEASSRQPPLMFTFQLDVGPEWGFEDPDEDGGGGGGEEFSPALEGVGGGSGGIQDFAGAYMDGSEVVFDQMYLLPRTTDSASTSSLDASLTYPLSDSRRSSSSPPLPSPRRVKIHICWICQKEFPRPSGLATHMHTHSGAKPFRCPVPACGKPFAVRSNARRHLRTHSPEELATAFAGAEVADGGGETASDSPSPLPFVVDDVKCETFAYQFGRAIHGPEVSGNPLVVGAC